MNKVKNYLTSIGLELSDSKTKITNLNTGKVLFLGTEIFRAREHSFAKLRSSQIIKRNSRKLRLQAPLNRIVSKLQNTNFMRDNVSHAKFI